VDSWLVGLAFVIALWALGVLGRILTVLDSIRKLLAERLPPDDQ
jgi:hypothetical protein